MIETNCLLVLVVNVDKLQLNQILFNLIIVDFNVFFSHLAKIKDDELLSKACLRCFNTNIEYFVNYLIFNPQYFSEVFGRVLSKRLDFDFLTFNEDTNTILRDDLGRSNSLTSFDNILVFVSSRQ